MYGLKKIHIEYIKSANPLDASVLNLYACIYKKKVVSLHPNGFMPKELNILN